MQNFEPAAFVIDDDAKAQWAIDKIREAQENTARWKEHYAAALKKITEADTATVEYMTELLRQYFDTVPHHKTRTQETYTLPGGMLVCKAQEPEYKRDPEKLLAWALKNAPDCVKTEQTVNWSDIKKRCAAGTAALKDTGEIVEGVEVIQRPAAFTVSVK